MFVASPFSAALAATLSDAEHLSGISQNWSGYETVGGAFSGVGAAWKVPLLTHAVPSSTYAVWIGMGGEQENGLIQIGTHALELGPEVVRYSAWYELFPDKPHVIPVPVRAGDMVKSFIVQKSPGLWTLSFTNTTNKRSYQISIRRTGLFSSAEWIVEKSRNALGNFTPFGQFGSVSFTSVSAIKNGVTRTLFGAEATPITMVDFENRTLLAHVSATRDDGHGFTVRRDAPGAVWQVPTGYVVSKP